MALDNFVTRGELFQKILQSELENQTIENIELIEEKPVAEDEVGFLSCLTRFTLKYNISKEYGDRNVEKFLHLILKEEPKNASQVALDMFSKLGFFGREGEILQFILPKIEELVDKKLGPKAYYVSADSSTIVMEDLVAHGFKTRDQKFGLRKKEIIMVLENLAEYHAGSVLLNEKNFRQIAKITTVRFNEDMSGNLTNMWKGNVDAVVNGIRSWPDEKFRKISEKIVRISERMFESLKNISKYDEDEFCVLNHGDLWLSNMMFRDDENGEPQDVRFIDYQMGVWSSPVVDLHYFLNMSPELNLKFDSDEALLDVYLTRLTRTMEKIGCVKRALTIKQLKKSFHKYRFWGAIVNFCYYPKSLQMTSEVTLESILGERESSMDFLENPMYVKTLEKVLPIMDERGYFD